MPLRVSRGGLRDPFRKKREFGDLYAVLGRRRPQPSRRVVAGLDWFQLRMPPPPRRACMHTHIVCVGMHAMRARIPFDDDPLNLERRRED